jgi:hypothetical protein
MISLFVTLLVPLAYAAPWYIPQVTPGGVSVIPFGMKLMNISLGDDNVQALHMPFSFEFYGRQYDYAYLSSNGLVSFAEGVAPTRAEAKTDGKKPDNGIHSSGVNKDDTYVVVLHRNLDTKRTMLMANVIRSQDADNSAPSFKATVAATHEHLGMLTIHSATKQAISFLSNHKDVKYVQKSITVKALEVSSQVSTNTYSWGLDRIDQTDLPLDQAPFLPNPGDNIGSGVNVYVVDTGLDTTHVEFSGSGRTVANIFDGYNGGGAISPNNDVNGHGTHCAGTVGGNNVGVARGVNIYGVKVLSDSGSGSSSTIIAGLNRVLADRMSSPAQPMVVSMSLGGYCGSSCSVDSMIDAVEILSDNNITVVVAAGNSADDACLYTPAAAPSAITVGSTDRYDDLSSFSSYGTCVDMLAPGSSVNSACSSASNAACVNGDSYVEFSGTSMACPHVSGLSAQWLAQLNSSPMVPAEDVKKVLQCSAAPLKISGVPSNTPNLFLQLPDDSTAVEDVHCPPTCTVTDPATGEVCSGRGTCTAGFCSCNGDYGGANCEFYLPSWITDPFCCSGDDLSDSTNAPFNAIAFLWTDLYPNAGIISHGLVDPDTYVISFDGVEQYDMPSSCDTHVELVLGRSGSVQIIYIQNNIGNGACGKELISVGLKGARDDFNYTQVFGPSAMGLPQSATVTFSTTRAPTLAPTISVAPTVTMAPTISPPLTWEGGTNDVTSGISYSFAPNRNGVYKVHVEVFDTDFLSSYEYVTVYVNGVEVVAECHAGGVDCGTTFSTCLNDHLVQYTRNGQPISITVTATSSVNICPHLGYYLYVRYSLERMSYSVKPNEVSFSGDIKSANRVGKRKWASSAGINFCQNHNHDDLKKRRGMITSVLHAPSTDFINVLFDFTTGEERSVAGTTIKTTYKLNGVIVNTTAPQLLYETNNFGLDYTNSDEDHVRPGMYRFGIRVNCTTASWCSFDDEYDAEVQIETRRANGALHSRDCVYIPALRAD